VAVGQTSVCLDLGRLKDLLPELATSEGRRERLREAEGHLEDQRAQEAEPIPGLAAAAAEGVKCAAWRSSSGPSARRPVPPPTPHGKADLTIEFRLP
jgi:hypothetical protein